ncbi:MAG: microcompartment protein [Sporomusa sp.]|jgi:microcompartment protein CcmL/EutN|nr:microcompartment protein [Sporomusa sp.]
MVNALGLMEVVGLAAGLEAADAAIKAANVTLIGYELTKGGGMVVIKISGDVGAVTAAVDAGTAAASKIGTVFASHVIPRPGNGLNGMITTKETVGVNNKEGRQARKSSDKELVQTDDKAKGNNASAIKSDTAVVNKKATGDMHPAGTCNLCGDPACPRHKGEPKTTCIHYKKNHHREE